MKNKVLWIVILCILVAVGFAEKTPPSWMVDPKIDYPDEKYIACVGHGVSEDAARTNALATLAGYFNTVFSNSTTSSSIMVDNNGDVTKQRSINQDFKIQTEVELFAVDYSEIYFNKKTKTYYCVAFIDKAAYWKKLSQKIETQKKEFENYYFEAEKLTSVDFIIAKKYYVLAEESGKKLENMISISDFFVDDFKNEYKQENQIIEASRKIKKIEDSIEIFMDIQGDWNNTVASTVMMLFENEKYNFTTNRKKCTHIMKIKVEQNLIVTGKDTDYETISVSPSVVIMLTNPNTQQDLFSFSRKISKSVAFSQEVALRKGYENLCKDLEKNLMQSFHERM